MSIGFSKKMRILQYCAYSFVSLFQTLCLDMIGSVTNSIGGYNEFRELLCGYPNICSILVVLYMSGYNPDCIIALMRLHVSKLKYVVLEVRRLAYKFTFSLAVVLSFLQLFLFPFLKQLPLSLGILVLEDVVVYKVLMVGDVLPSLVILYFTFCSY